MLWSISAKQSLKMIASLVPSIHSPPHVCDNSCGVEPRNETVATFVSLLLQVHLMINLAFIICSQISDSFLSLTFTLLSSFPLTFLNNEDTVIVDTCILGSLNNKDTAYHTVHILMSWGCWEHKKYKQTCLF